MSFLPLEGQGFGQLINVGVMMTAGFFGGLLNTLQVYMEEGKKPHFRPLVPKLTVSGLFGVGGAMAVLLASEWLGKMPKGWLEHLTLGVVSGFIGYKILPAIAESLQRRMSEAENTLKTQKAELEKQEQDLKKTRAEFGEDMKRAQELLNKTKAISDMSYFRSAMVGSHKITEWERVAREMQQHMEELGSKTDLPILLAYANKRLGKYDEAIGLLTDFIANLPEGLDHKLETAFYNRACYYLTTALDTDGRTVKDPNRIQKGLDDLRKAIELLPANRHEAWEDADFDPVKSMPAFLEIAGERPAKGSQEQADQTAKRKKAKNRR